MSIIGPRFDPTVIPADSHCEECANAADYEWQGDALPDGAALVCCLQGLLAPAWVYECEVLW